MLTLPENQYTSKFQVVASPGLRLWCHMRALLVFIVIVLQSGVAAAQERVSFLTSDGWLIYAHRYGEGKRGVVLVHGGRFTKESWAKQAQPLTNAEFEVLAIDMRGYGESTNGPTALRSDYGSPLDVLGIVVKTW